jgi:DNA modification methylase
VKLLLGDCIDRMREMDKGSVAAVVTDPPYGLGFMGRDWDSPGGLGDHPMRRNHGTNTVNTGVTRQGRELAEAAPAVPAVDLVGTIAKAQRAQKAAR